MNNTSLLLSDGITTKTIGSPTTVDPISGLHLATYGFNLSINNLNQVAFTAGGVNAGAPIGVYVSDGSNVVTVARVGDTLFGSRITALDMTDQSINDIGQVVFTVTLANGRTAIVRGTLPGTVAVPESGTLTLTLSSLGIIGTLISRRRMIWGLHFY